MFGPTRSVPLQSTLLLALLAMRAPAQSIAPETGETADLVMVRAESLAAAQNKKILLTFGASWCGNCRLFDKFLTDPSIRPIIEKTFVLADLNTGERSNDKRHANIPGGVKLQNSLGGKNAGYPYIVMLDANGKRVSDSLEPVHGHGENIGYPASPHEIDWFVEMLKKAAPSLSPQETATVHDWLTLHRPGRS